MFQDDIKSSFLKIQNMIFITQENFKEFRRQKTYFLKTLNKKLEHWLFVILLIGIDNSHSTIACCFATISVEILLFF